MPARTAAEWDTLDANLELGIDGKPVTLSGAKLAAWTERERRRAKAALAAARKAAADAAKQATEIEAAQRNLDIPMLANRGSPRKYEDWCQKCLNAALANGNLDGIECYNWKGPFLSENAKDKCWNCRAGKRGTCEEMERRVAVLGAEYLTARFRDNRNKKTLNKLRSAIQIVQELKIDLPGATRSDILKMVDNNVDVHRAI